MKTSAQFVAPARSIRCALALLCGSFLVSTLIVVQAADSKPLKGDEVARLVDAAEAGVGVAKDREGKAVTANGLLWKAKEAADKATPNKIEKKMALDAANDRLKDAKVRKDAADKGAKEAEAAANKPGATDADRARAKQAREVAQAAFRKVDEMNALVTQRSAEFNIAGAADRAVVTATENMAKAKTALDTATTSAQSLLNNAAREADRLQKSDTQKERLLKRVGDLRAKLDAIKKF